MKFSSSGYKVLYKGQGNFTFKMVKQLWHECPKGKIEIPNGRTLAGKITTIKNDDCTR